MELFVETKIYTFNTTCSFHPKYNPDYDLKAYLSSFDFAITFQLRLVLHLYVETTQGHFDPSIK